MAYDQDCRRRCPGSWGSGITESPRSLYDVVHRKLGHTPFTRLHVVLGGGENMPVSIVQLRMIGTIIVTRPAGFLPEQRVAGHRFRRQDPVMEFPGALQLVQVLGAEAVEILSQHRQALQGTV